MRRKILVSMIVLGALSPDLFAQQPSAPDTTKAAPQPAVQSDSVKNEARAKAEASHRRKVLLWTVGIGLFIALNLLISDRPSR